MSTCRRFEWIFTTILLLAAPSSWAQTQHVPISDYLAQADYTGYAECWWNPRTRNVVVCLDTVGGRVSFFGGDVGTTVAGHVTVRALQDGRAHVTVLMHMASAVCFAFEGPDLAFGATPRQVVLSGYPASLGSGTARYEFTMPSMDTPLPPLWQVGTAEYPFDSLLAQFSCTGTLTGASGYAEGTPGMAHVTQRALFAAGSPTVCPGGDCWPAELAFYKPTGK